MITTNKFTLRKLAVHLIPAPLMDTLRLGRLAKKADPELALLSILSNGGAFLDIGANIGVYSYVARKFFAEIHAFEPHPVVARRLKSHGWKNVQVWETALSDQASKQALFVPTHDSTELTTRSSLRENANPGMDQSRTEVTSNRLDDIGLNCKKIDLIKIDVEGHEWAVIKGGKETLQRFQPTLIVEIEERHHPGDTLLIFKDLESMGYQGYFLDQGRLRSIADFSIDTHQNPDNAKRPGEVGATHLYVNNFVFVAAKSALDLLVSHRLLDR